MGLLLLVHPQVIADDFGIWDTSLRSCDTLMLEATQQGLDFPYGLITARLSGPILGDVAAQVGKVTLIPAPCEQVLHGEMQHQVKLIHVFQCRRTWQLSWAAPSASLGMLYLQVGTSSIIPALDHQLGVVVLAPTTMVLVPELQFHTEELNEGVSPI